MDLLLQGTDNYFDFVRGYAGCLLEGAGVSNEIERIVKILDILIDRETQSLAESMEKQMSDYDEYMGSPESSEDYNDFEGDEDLVRWNIDCENRNVQHRLGVMRADVGAMISSAYPGFGYHPD